MLDWDLIRYFLAVARSGSTLTAARGLGQSQPTVARRIAALEHALGARLFDRRQAGYRLTSEGCALVPEAEAVEAAALRFADRCCADRRRVAGTVRLTTFDMFANMALGAAMQEFGRLYPDVKVEVVVGERLFDLAAGEADIALRAGKRPEAGPLVCRKVGEDRWALYASRAYAEARGLPDSPEALNGHSLIAGDGHLARIPAMTWLAEMAPDAEVRLRCNAVQNLITGVEAGIGLSMLPEAFVRHNRDLIQVLPPPPELHTECWLITHERLKDEPRIRAMMDFLADFVRRRWGSLPPAEEPMLRAVPLDGG